MMINGILLDDMNYSFEYSNGALESKPKFESKEFICFVEGHDDVIFWEKRFENAGINDVFFEEVGGKEEIEKFILKLGTGLKAILCLDKDYNFILNRENKDGKVVYTYGHSIENTLYCSNSIKNYILKLGRFPKKISNLILKAIELEYINFETKVYPLLKYEIANEKISLECNEQGIVNNNSVSILGNNTCKFLYKNNSIIIAEDKVKTTIDLCIKKIPNEIVIELEKTMSTNKLNTREIVRGHFLTNWVINLVKKIIKDQKNQNVKIELQSVFPSLVEHCLTCKVPSCVKKTYYNTNIKKAYLELFSLL